MAPSRSISIATAVPQQLASCSASSMETSVSVMAPQVASVPSYIDGPGHDESTEAATVGQVGPSGTGPARHRASPRLRPIRGPAGGVDRTNGRCRSTGPGRGLPRQCPKAGPVPASPPPRWALYRCAGAGEVRHPPAPGAGCGGAPSRPWTPAARAEQLRRSIAMLPPGRRDALDRERALKLLDELAETQDRLEALRRRLRELAEHDVRVSRRSLSTSFGVGARHTQPPGGAP